MIRQYQLIDAAAELPPADAHSRIGVSKWVFVLGETIGGEAVNALACYDHERQRWLIALSGVKRIIHWLKELP